MITKRLGVVLFLVVILVAGCGRAGQTASDEFYMPVEPQAEPAVMERAAAEGEEAVAFISDTSVGDSVLNTEDVPQERIIIRTGDMSIVVTDTESAMNTIAQMVVDNGGWVVDSSVYQYAEDTMSGNMSVRIPSEGFDSFLEAVRQLSVEVTRVSTSGQDVTEEYVDLSARLENLEVTAERVRSFLDEAKTVEEALEVNRELSRLEGDIEALKGRLQYLDQSAAFSLITITLTPDILAQPLEVGGWKPQGVARSALETLIATLQTLVDIAIWFVIYVLPVALLIGIPVWLLIRFFRRRRAERKVEDDAA